MNDAKYVKVSDVVDWFRPYGHMDERIPFETIVSDLRDAIPSADVAPVVHARWETDEVTGEKYCSDCLERAVFTSGHFYHCADYCPHCGAKMDG